MTPSQHETSGRDGQAAHDGVADPARRAQGFEGALQHLDQALTGLIDRTAAERHALSQALAETLGGIEALQADMLAILAEDDATRAHALAPDGEAA